MLNQIQLSQVGPKLDPSIHRSESFILKINLASNKINKPNISNNDKLPSIFNLQSKLKIHGTQNKLMKISGVVSKPKNINNKK